MAIDIPDDLIQLKHASEEAKQAALSAGYSPEGWAPWREAAERYQAAVTAHAEAAGVNRYELEKAVGTAVLHPEPPAE
ncbi:hypothetical protein [Streptomyces sp. NPDC060194]|uniref:hypothetical protein n=1 Tax=Streptomyces sp. NPDC060194 TaxID=3347069 RepID=UPI00365B5C1D